MIMQKIKLEDILRIKKFDMLEKKRGIILEMPF